MTITVKQEAEYDKEGFWSWSVWLDGPAGELDRIEHVTYALHPSYSKPLRRVDDRRTNFRLYEEGWSSFALSIDVQFKDGSKQQLTHQVDLENRVTSAQPSVERLTTRRLGSDTQKKLLSIDSGGARSAISIRILARIESLLRQEYAKPDLVLADYFHYIAGTSTGAVIAAALSLGMSVDDVYRFFVAFTPMMFTKATLIKRITHKYESEPLAQKLREVFGSDVTLGSSRLRTLLMIVVRNATTNEAWPLSNNPLAKYNNPARVDSNLELPLWQLVRASTAAPTYFPPEVVRVGSRDFVFVDGGVTTYANPSLLLFLMATAQPYRLGWPVGEDKMLLVSVGSGIMPSASAGLRPEEMNLLYNATTIPSALMKSTRDQQDLLCRMFGTCLSGPIIDREVGDMIGHLGPGREGMFTYVRYEPTLDELSLNSLGLSHINLTEFAFDSENVSDLREIGDSFSRQVVITEHLRNFL